MLANVVEELLGKASEYHFALSVEEQNPVWFDEDGILVLGGGFKIGAGSTVQKPHPTVESHIVEVVRQIFEQVATAHPN